MNTKDILHIIKQGENEKLEFKRLWKDEHLKTLCAFANTSGGFLLIGIEDNKTISGILDSEKLLENLPNKINNRLGIVPNINIEIVENKNINE